MKNKSEINNYKSENHLFATGKEEKHLAWAMLQKNNSFFSPLRPSGFLIDKNNKVFYKYKFLASIIGRYIYLVKKQLKLYSLFLLTLKRLIKRKYYKNNSVYFKVKKAQKFWIRKKKIIVYKKHIFLWYKKWFLKKYRKQRRHLWKSYHHVSYTFWGNLLKKRTKSLIFKLLNESSTKISFSLKSYNDLTKYIYFFIKKKKRKRINWKIKNKKYKINVGIPIYLQHFKFNLSKYKIKNVFPLQNKNNIMSEQFNLSNIKPFFFNIVNYQLNNLFMFFPNTNLFLINYNYFYYFLNLKNNKKFKLATNYLDYVIYFYKTLGMFYKNKSYHSNLLIRTGILKKKKTFSSLQHGKYMNFFFYWFSNFITKYMIKGKYIVHNLFFLISNNYKLLCCLNVFIIILKLKYNFKDNLFFFFKTRMFFLKKKNMRVLKKKSNKEIIFTSLKNSFLNKFSNVTRNRKKKIMKNHKKWYGNNAKNKYQTCKQRRFFFYPYPIKFKKKKKLKKKLNNVKKLYYLNNNSNFTKKKYYNKISNAKKKIKYLYMLKNVKKIIFFNKLKNFNLININNFNKKYNYVKKKKHFLKAYRKKYYRLLRYMCYKLYKRQKKRYRRYKSRLRYKRRNKKKYIFSLLNNKAKNAFIKTNRNKLNYSNSINYLNLYFNIFTSLINIKINLNKIIKYNFKLLNILLLLNNLNSLFKKNIKLYYNMFKFNKTKKIKKKHIFNKTKRIKKKHIFNKTKRIKKKYIFNKKNLLFFFKNNKLTNLKTQLTNLKTQLISLKKKNFFKKLKNSIYLLNLKKLNKKNRLFFITYRNKYKYRYYNRTININNLLKEFLVHFIYRLLIFYRSVTRFYLINIKLGTKYTEGNLIKNLLFDDYLVKLLKNEYFIIYNIKFYTYNLNGYYSKSLINYYDWVSVEYSRFYFFNLLNYNNQTKNNLIYKNYIFNI